MPPCLSLGRLRYLHATIRYESMTSDVIDELGDLGNPPRGARADLPQGERWSRTRASDATFFPSLGTRLPVSQEMHRRRMRIGRDDHVL